MSMRTYSASALALALAACGSPPAAAPGAARGEPLTETVDAAAAPSSRHDGRIACARGDAAFARTCTVERTRDAQGILLTVRDADGGFHRLRVTDDGRGVAAADGARPAFVGLAGDGIEVAVGDARYRLPATVKAAAAPR